MKGQSLIVTMSNGKPLLPFLKYQPDTLTISTNNTKHVGTYAVKFVGCYKTQEGISQQGVLILGNRPPYTNFTQLNYTFVVGTPGIIVVPMINDVRYSRSTFVNIT
jgi:hypothetical protein